MNISLHEKHKGVNRFCIHNGKLMFHDYSDKANPRLMFEEHGQTRELLSLTGPVQEIYAQEGYFYTNDDKGFGILINPGLKITRVDFLIEGLVTLNGRIHLIGLHHKDIDYRERKSFITPLDRHEIVWTFKNRIGQKRWHNEQIIFHDKDQALNIVYVGSVDVREKKELWSFNLQELRKMQHGWPQGSGDEVSLSGISPVYDGKVIVTMKNAGMLILNIADGSIHTYFNLKIFPNPLFQSQSRENIFFGINYLEYLEMDLGSGKVARQIQLDKLLPAELAIGASLIRDVTEYKGLIFFTMRNRYICCIDPVKESYVYHFDFHSIEKLALTPWKFQISNGRIYLNAYDKEVTDHFFILDLDI